VVLASFAQWVRARSTGSRACSRWPSPTPRPGASCARDQFGIKPLYLARDDDGRVFFASEIRPLLATGANPRRPDDTTVYRYLRYRVHHDTPRTFFAGIERLIPGAMAVLTPDGGVERSTYTSVSGFLSDP
jgi:asparagine synthase (glutamine-hydrolysing)